MKNFHIKSVLLGIGIGIVFTSIISIIYLADSNPAQALSEEEIVKLAEKYGMEKKPSGFIQNPLEQAESSNVEQDTGGSADEAGDEVEAEQPVAVLEIVYGDSSQVVAEKLVKLGLIENEEIFEKRVSEFGVSTRIRIGKFELNKEMGLDQMIQMITNSD